jgi:preprotein translocase subunit SecA
MLQELDRHWREHLGAMDYLRQGIHLRAYAQKNPKQEYKREAFELFGALLDRIKHGTVTLLSRLHVRTEAEIEEQEREHQRQLARRLQLQHAAPASAISSDVEPAAPETAPPGIVPPSPAGRFAPGPTAAREPAPTGPVVRDTRKIGRNEPCPCGSGKKYKHCHGALAREA